MARPDRSLSQGLASTRRAAPVRGGSSQLPKRNSIRTRHEKSHEVWFRILHVAPGHNGLPLVEFHEQTVEIALGPKGAFEDGSVGTLTRRVTADRVVNAAARARRPAKPLRQPRTPRVVELLRKAQEWRRQLDAGKVASQAEIARPEGITRGRVTPDPRPASPGFRHSAIDPVLAPPFATTAHQRTCPALHHSTEGHAAQLAAFQPYQQQAELLVCHTATSPH